MSEVSVQVGDISQFHLGQEIVLMARGWIFGQGVAVLENAHMDLELFPDAESAVQEVHTYLRYRDLRNRLLFADVIVKGQVLSLHDLESDLGESEHDPVWAEAGMHLEQVMCGATTGPSQRVRFSASNDIAWFESPKLKVGDEAIYLLQEDDASGAPGDGYFVLAPEAVRDPSEYQSLLDLLQNPPTLDLRD